MQRWSFCRYFSALCPTVLTYPSFPRGRSPLCRPHKAQRAPFGHEMCRALCVFLLCCRSAPCRGGDASQHRVQDVAWQRTEPFTRQPRFGGRLDSSIGTANKFGKMGAFSGIQTLPRLSRLLFLQAPFSLQRAAGFNSCRLWTRSLGCAEAQQLHPVWPALSPAVHPCLAPLCGVSSPPARNPKGKENSPKCGVCFSDSFPTRGF